MTSLRLLLRTRRTTFALLLLCAMATRLLVPAGYMPGLADGAMALTICPGVAQPAVPMTPRMHHGGDREQGHVAESPCAFAALVAPALGAAPPALLAAAVLFAFLATMRRPAPPVVARVHRLRPPLRAPPFG